MTTDEDAAIQHELLLGDIAILGQYITALQAALDRGDDPTDALTCVVRWVKFLAIDFGIAKELFDRYDRLRRQFKADVTSSQTN